jgi:hypothetical protein
MNEWLEDEDERCLAEHRWPLAPVHLLPRERWLWWEQLWSEVIMLAGRYRMRPGNDWWEDSTHVEALAALAAWVARYDSGEWDDPPGKLALLCDLERIRELVRGQEPFDPRRDRAAFCQFLVDTGCQPPPGREPDSRRGR